VVFHATPHRIGQNGRRMDRQGRDVRSQALLPRRTSRRERVFSDVQWIASQRDAECLCVRTVWQECGVESHDVARNCVLAPSPHD
jgi:hypothetical protein